MPLFTCEIPKDKAKKMALKITQIMTENPFIYLVPSTFSGQEQFEPIRYWRGPVWIVINVMLADGLQHYGFVELARKICIDSLKLVYTTMNDNGGFCEYFDPLTGKGLGSPLQSWTAASIYRLTELLSQK
jgi:glycogen debranching enzyme